MRPLLGTFVEIGVLASDDFGDAIDNAFERIAEVHRLLSFQDADSELSQLNATHNAWVALSPTPMRVLRLAKLFGNASGDLFNCTVGGAMIDKGLLPNHGGDALLAGKSADIELTATHARLRRPVRIVLDGIAKGFAVDLAVATLRDCGVPSGWVNAGGDARVFGAARLFTQRREPDGNFALLGAIQDASIASSSSHAQSGDGFMSELIGEPSKSLELGMTSVIAHRAWRADALTKVAALAPRNQRDVLIAHLGGRIVVPTQTLAA